MSYHITDLGRTIQRFRSEYDAATPPAPAATHAKARRGLGGANDMGHHLARVNSPATKYEDPHEQEFGGELSGMIFICICALCFLIAAGFAIAAPYILRLLFALFDLLAGMI